MEEAGPGKLPGKVNYRTFLRSDDSYPPEV